MSNAAAVQTKIDKMREDKKEYNAFLEYQDLLRQQAKDKKKWGGFGSILGAIGGFLMGGPAGMIAGWGAGKSVGRTWAQWEDYDESERFLTKEVFKGGKFNVSDMKTMVDQAHEYNEDMKESMYSQLVMDAIITGLGVKMAGGFMDKAGKEAWKTLSFGNKLSVGFGGSPGGTGERAVTRSQNIIEGGVEQYGATADIHPDAYYDTSGNLVTPPGLLPSQGGIGTSLGEGMLTATKSITKGLFMPGGDTSVSGTLNLLNAASSGQIDIATLLKLSNFGFKNNRSSFDASNSGGN